MIPHESRFQVGWAQVDVNGHMRNSAYLDFASDTRMQFFAANGFPMSEFARLRLGPVVRRDELDYYRELHLLDRVRVTMALAGLSEDAGRFRIRNEFYREDGVRAAAVTSTIGWLDLVARKLAPAPAPLADLVRGLPRTGDFSVIEVRPRGPGADTPPPPAT